MFVLYSIFWWALVYVVARWARAQGPQPKNYLGKEPASESEQLAAYLNTNLRDARGCLIYIVGGLGYLFLLLIEWAAS